MKREENSDMMELELRKQDCEGIKTEETRFFLLHWGGRRLCLTLFCHPQNIIFP